MHDSEYVKLSNKMLKLNSNQLPYIINNAYRIADDQQFVDFKNINKYNYKRDSSILLYLKPYSLVKDKYEKRLTEKYWNITGIDVSDDEKNKIKLELNKEIRKINKNIRSLMYNYELIFNKTDSQNHFDKTRIIISEKNGIVAPIEREQIKAKLKKVYDKLLTSKIQSNITRQKNIIDIEKKYINSINSHSNKFNIELVTSSGQRIAAIRKAKDKLEILYQKLGEIKTENDEIEFLKLLKFANFFQLKKT
jgi:uncharacterized coiled-coil protein SlyX